MRNLKINVYSASLGKEAERSLDTRELAKRCRPLGDVY